MPVSSSGILVEQESWWNRHLACFMFQHIGRTGILPVSCSGILVEQASCLLQFPASWWNRNLGGTGILPVSFSGILVEWACWWNRHLACYNYRAGRMPTPLMFIPPFSNAGFLPDSRFPIPDSRFPIPDSLYYPNTS
ncbi:hypothetical protein [Moorena producens]|uniref:hypothetical protein n=1 Tax=Moorena producens TaxID=1155739 RepID=UPI003C74A80E